MNMAVLVYSNIHIVDKNKLPNNEAFNANMAMLSDISQFTTYYSFEWNYPVDKSNLIDFLEAFHKDIVRINTKNDYELNLLNAVLMTYLYNLDEIDYYEEIVITLEKMKIDFPNEFRTYWLYGNFMISAAKPLIGYNQYKLILNLYSDNLNSYTIDFLYDYAYACIMVQMPNSAMKIYELAAKNGGTPLASNRFYKSIEKGFKDAIIGNIYADKDVWEIIKSNDIYYLRSRMFGSLFPLMETWAVRMTGLNNNNKSFCAINPDQLISKNNNSIGITILIEFDLNNQPYDDFLKEKHNIYPVVEQTKKTIGNHKYDIIIYEDKTKYRNMGGARGYYIATCVEYKNKSNSSIEIPIEFNNTSKDGLNYYPLMNYFNRINQSINIGILLDSSNEIFNEASDFIFEYLEDIIIE
jgi:hypothetical protein